MKTQWRRGDKVCLENPPPARSNSLTRPEGRGTVSHTEKAEDGGGALLLGTEGQRGPPQGAVTQLSERASHRTAGQALQQRKK